jgi:multidrug efflux pump subunit AcrA (membrane-fusion protein)
MPNNSGSAQHIANPPETLAAIAPNLPVGTVIVSPGILSRVNQHNRGSQGQNWPVTITVISPPAHGTVTTREADAPVTNSNGVTRIAPVTQVFYQSAPGFTGMDSFTYQRTSGDPTDPINGKVFTINIDAVAR